MIQLALGFMCGLIADAIWWNSTINKYEKKLLSVVEHFHWATVCLILYTQFNFTFLIGLSLALLSAEWSEPFQYEIKHPFSFGSPHFKGSVLLGGILVFLLVVITLVQARP